MKKPDFIIGGADRPYMLRWFVIPRNRWFNIYLHKILRDDDDRALHDHRAWNASIILRGSYREITPDYARAPTSHLRVADVPTKARIRRRGALVFRRATDPHRLEVVKSPVWTLFIKGPDIREWGFHCPQGWTRWQDFVSSDDPGAIGRGCEQ